MPERVTFTKKSADRIAKVVKQVENMPAAEPIQQRRRAGGYKMQSLFEVTAVQTGEETVTLKRVQDTDDNLNDRSESVDVAYDPDNEPSVGDQGLIVRLGDGTRFFFRRVVAAISSVIIEATDYRYVDENFPDTNFGNGTQSISMIDDVGGQERIGIMQFERQILPADPAFSIILLREIMQYVPSVLTDNAAGVGEGAQFFMDIYKITNDFDPSAITWNNYSGLSLTLIGGGAGASLGNIAAIIDIGDASDSAGGVYTIASAGVEFALTNGQSYSWDFSNAYGMTLRMRGAVHQGTPKSWDCTMRLEINDEKTLLMAGLPN